MKQNFKEIISINKKRLRKFHRPYNPVVGDSDDKYRFLLNVRGLRKVWIPTPMKQTPLIKKLLKAKSLSAFFRTPYFLDNFSSPTLFFKAFNNLRESFDFPFWVCRNFRKNLKFNNYRFLLQDLNKIMVTQKAPRIIISKYRNSDISSVICLLIAWKQMTGSKRLNAFHFLPNVINATKLKNFYLDLDPNSKILGHRYSSLNKSSICLPEKKSKLWFAHARSVHACRSLDFNFLYLSDISRWKGAKLCSQVYRAAFPVIPVSRESLIIIDGSISSARSFFAKEFSDAQKNISPFTPIHLPWYKCSKHSYSFEEHSERVEFAKRMLKYAKKNYFPGYPGISGKIVYSLWEKGLPLETIYWYATESRLYPNSSRFRTLYPV